MARRPKQYIYALSDPRDGVIGYVSLGDKSLRSTKQLLLSDSEQLFHHSKWLKRLVLAGFEPKMTVLESVEVELAHERLQYWVDLISNTDGLVDSVKRRRAGWSEERKERYRQKRTGVPIKQRDPHGLRAQALRETWKRKKAEGLPVGWGGHTEETRKKIGDAVRAAKEFKIKKQSLKEAREQDTFIKELLKEDTWD